MSDHHVPRRTFLKLAALGTVGAALNECASASAVPAPERRGFHPGRTERRAALFVKERLADAVGIAFEGQGPIFEVWEEHRPNADVVINHLPFGEAGLRIENFIDVGERDFSSAEDYF